MMNPDRCKCGAETGPRFSMCVRCAVSQLRAEHEAQRRAARRRRNVVHGGRDDR